MNGKTKTLVGATTAIMTVVIAGGIMLVVRSSSETNAALVGHELSVESHPVINTKVDSIAVSVEKIAGNVETMMIRQERQTVMMENVIDDIAELKEEHN